MDWERLISDYLDDALTPDEAAALFQWVHSHPDNARQFARAAFLHRRLQHRLSAMRLLSESSGFGDADLHVPSDAMISPGWAEEAAAAPPARPVKTGSSLTWRRFWASAAAILLIVGVLAFIAWPPRSPARLLAAENATWGAGVAPLKEGDRLPARALVLDSGLIQLGFDNGNQLIIEGPARFTVADARAITLDRGALTAVVTKAGRGFSVSTPAARVTDRGTEFGVLASDTVTQVTVFSGKVIVDHNSAGAAPQELAAGSAVEVSAAGIRPVPFDPMAFKRVGPFEGRRLDLIDLLAGGDGAGSASGVGIDAATGRAREMRAVTIRRGDQRYLRVNDHRVLDGCFIPGGRMPVDSAGHLFAFPATSLFSYGLIWAGPNIPWEGELPIATTFAAEQAAPAASRVLVMHSNNGITLDLDAIRALHPAKAITGFRARVGNSYRPEGPGSGPARPLASIHVIVDGVARFEKRSFANEEPPFDVACPLSDTDRFLTLATTDGGDGNACDWILWVHPEFAVERRGQ